MIFSTIRDAVNNQFFNHSEFRFGKPGNLAGGAEKNDYASDFPNSKIEVVSNTRSFA